MVSVISSCLVEAQCDTIGMAKDRDPLNLLQTQVLPRPAIVSRDGAHPHVGTDRHPHGSTGTGSTGARTGLADGTIAGPASVRLAGRVWEHRDCCVVF